MFEKDWSSNQKFSSMGNGFTFELESLIFWALSKSVSDFVSVYGDDIIVDSTCRDRFVDLFRFCGFTTNESKSFWSGPFRESCGKHYFQGTDVTPIYQKDSDENIENLLASLNRLRRWYYRRYGVWPNDFSHVKCRSRSGCILLERKLREVAGSVDIPRCPVDLGDVGINDADGYNVSYNYGYRRIRVLKLSKAQTYTDPAVALWSYLRSGYCDRPSYGRVPKRGGRKMFNYIWIPV
jgi:hypothetical protein